MTKANRQTRLLQLVLSDESLIKKYNINPTDYTNIDTAMNADNAVVECIAMIIEGINDQFDETDQKQLYHRIQQYLNNNLLI